MREVKATVLLCLSGSRYDVFLRMYLIRFVWHKCLHSPAHSFLNRRIRTFLLAFLIHSLPGQENPDNFLLPFLCFPVGNKWKLLEICHHLLSPGNDRYHIAAPEFASWSRWHMRNWFLHILVGLHF